MLQSRRFLLQATAKSTFLRSFSVASESVTLEKRGQIGILRLNDPNRLNALTADMGDRVQELVREITENAHEYRAIVLTGEERAKDTTSRNVVTMRKFYGRFLSLRTLPVPVVAAINGPAIGAGMCISLFADVRVVAKDAKLGFTFVHLGLHPGMACTHFLPLLIGQEKANYLLLSGKVISGEEAFQYGLASKVVDKEDVVAEAIKVAEELTSGSSVATRSLLQTLRLKQDKDLEMALDREASSQAGCYISADYKEGVDAISAKRKPNFGPLEHYN
ncbi:putative enoyl CoA hydratase [Aphanomyces cochlioides]|nr:putative enoyl CoA hydratase [Aphanomyces cochlioides]